MVRTHAEEQGAVQDPRHLADDFNRGARASAWLDVAGAGCWIGALDSTPDGVAQGHDTK